MDQAPLTAAEKLREKYKLRENQELVLLRTKLEVRTWFLRASLALNIGLISGLIVWLITK